MQADSFFFQPGFHADVDAAFFLPVEVSDVYIGVCGVYSAFQYNVECFLIRLVVGLDFASDCKRILFL